MAAADAGALLELQKRPLAELTEQERIALLGRPRLGDAIRAQIRVKESKEFKVSRRPQPRSSAPPRSTLPTANLAWFTPPNVERTALLASRRHHIWLRWRLEKWLDESTGVSG